MRGRPVHRGLLGAGLLVAVLAGAGCSAEGSGDRDAAPSSPSSPSSPASSAPAATASTPAPASASPTQPSGPAATPAAFDPDRAMRHVEVLAGRIGPRLATGPAFRKAAAYVEQRFRRHGYTVSRERFPVPAGDSWGVPVRAGSSFNVVAVPPGFDPAAPYRLVGAHLDTVAAAPGAEDNASGVALLLEVARLSAREGTALPTVLVAFGAEEPRGPGDDRHHFGSQEYVRAMSATERSRLRAMVSLDRVGVGSRVPVCTGPISEPRVRDALIGLADRLGIPTDACADNTASDHWSFEKAGHDVARLGSTPYAGYHSAGDVPSVVGAEQLGRSGRLIWAWLRAG